MEVLLPIIIKAATWAAKNWVFVTLTAASTVLSYSQVQNAKRQARRAMNSLLDSGRRLDVRFNTLEPRNIIYGTSRVGGLVVLPNTTGDKGKFYNVLKVIADHPCEDWDAVYLSDEIAIQRNGYVNPKFVSGSEQYFFAEVVTDGNGPNATMRSWFNEDLTDDHKFTGCTLLAVRYVYDPANNVWPNGPIAPTITVKGKVVYDSRSETDVYSDNPSNCILDYVRNVAKVEDDYINFESFIEAANDCDETVEVIGATTGSIEALTVNANTTLINVTGSGNIFEQLQFNNPVTASFIQAGTKILSVNVQNNNQFITIDLPTINNSLLENVNIDLGNGNLTEKRYTLNGVVYLDENPAETIKQMLTSCRGRLIFDGGFYSLKVAKYRAPTVLIREEDTLATIEVKTKFSQKDSLNSIRGNFINPNENYKATSFPAITSSFFLTEDNNISNDLEVEYSFTNSPSMCQRLAKQELLDNRLDFMVQIKTTLKSYILQPTDTVQIRNRAYNWLGTTGAPYITFEVISTSTDFNGPHTLLNLKETSSDIYNWNANEEKLIPTKPVPTLNNPFDVDPPVITSVVGGTSALKILTDGTVVPNAIITFSASDNRAQSTEIEYKLSSESDFTFFTSVSNNGASNKISIPVGTSGDTYNFRLRNKSYTGQYSIYVFNTTIILGKNEAPQPPVIVSVLPAYEGAQILWTNNVIDVDYDYTEIITGSQNNDTYVAISGRAAFIALPPSSSTDVYLRNYDTTGNSSSFASIVVSTLTDLEGSDPRVDIILGALPEFSASISASNAAIAELELTASNTVSNILAVASDLDSLSGSFMFLSSSVSSSFNDQSSSFASSINDLSLTVTNNSQSFALNLTNLSSSFNNTSASLNSSIQTIETTFATQDFTLAQINTGLSSSFTNGIARESLTAEINIVNTTITNGDSALASSITTLDSKFQSATSSLNASISNIETTFATQDFAVAQTNNTISASLQPGGIGSSSIAASVSTEASARATADGNLAGQYVLDVAAGDIITGMKITSVSTSGTPVSNVTFRASNFRIVSGSGTPIILLDLSDAGAVFTPDLLSSNYSADSAGWKIKNNGDAEFNNTKIRGNLVAGAVSTLAAVFNPARPEVTFPTVTSVEEIDTTPRTSLGAGGTIIDLCVLNGFGTGGTGFKDDAFGKSDVHVFVSISGGYNVALNNTANTDIVYKINSGGYVQINQVSAESLDSAGSFNMAIGAKITGLTSTDVITFAINAKSSDAATQFNACQMTVQCFNL